MINTNATSTFAADKKFIPKPNYATVMVQWRSTAFPLLEETLEIRTEAEKLCDDATITYIQKHPKNGYQLHQTLQSPDLKTIGQFVSGKIFVSKFVYGCNGVYLRND
ncbi:hypothetical protein [Nostoc sp.]